MSLRLGFIKEKEESLHTLPLYSLHLLSFHLQTIRLDSLVGLMQIAVLRKEWQKSQVG